MIKGKALKLTGEERQEKIDERRRERDMFEICHMKHYDMIFPYDSRHFKEDIQAVVEDA